MSLAQCAQCLGKGNAVVWRFFSSFPQKIRAGRRRGNGVSVLDIDSIFTIIDTTNNRAQDEPKHRQGQEVGGIYFLPVFCAP